jgi:hypothetical protein
MKNKINSNNKLLLPRPSIKQLDVQIRVQEECVSALPCKP